MSSDYPVEDEFYEEAKSEIDRLVEAGSRLATAAENYSQLDYKSEAPLNSKINMTDMEALREMKASVPFVSEMWEETQNCIFDMYRNIEILEDSDLAPEIRQEIEEEIDDLEETYQPLDRELGKLDRALEEIGLSISKTFDRIVYRSNPGQTTYRMNAD